jgi:serine/threonine-protein kinase
MTPAPADPAEVLEPGSMVDGKYRIEQRLGSGGMGVVYAAWHTELDRPVALKVISRRHTSDKRLVERFRREARIASQARHPNIVEVLDLGLYEDRWYLAMELLEGIDLHDAIVLKKTYDPPEVLSVLDPVLSALDHAHSLGLVHRDLKPENIFLARLPSGDIQVKLLDFGVVKVPDVGAQSQLTRTGTVVGTPEYMAPEQAMDATVDARADLYAAGCVVYAMLCGRPPFVDKSILRVLSAHVASEPKPVAVMRPGLKQARRVDVTLMKALAKNPDQRYQSAQEMRKAFTELAAALGNPRYVSERITLPLAARALDDTHSSVPERPIPPPAALPEALPLAPASPTPQPSGSRLGIAVAALIGATLAALATWLLTR